MKAATKKYIGYGVVVVALGVAAWAVWKIFSAPAAEIDDTAPTTGVDPNNPVPGTGIASPSTVPVTSARIPAGKTVRMAKQCYIRKTPVLDATLKNLYGSGVGYPGQIVGAATGKTTKQGNVTWVECKRANGDLVYVGRSCVYGADA